MWGLMCGRAAWLWSVNMYVAMKLVDKMQSSGLDDPQVAPVAVGAPIREESAGGNDAPRRVGVSQVPRALPIRGESRIG